MTRLPFRYLEPTFFAGLLDANDVGAEIGENLGRVGPEDHAGQVEDADARERAFGAVGHAQSISA